MLRADLVNLGRVLVSHQGDIDAAVAPGPRRGALAPPDTAAQAKRAVESFDDAVLKVEHGDNQALLALLNRDRHDLDDPTPCRPD